MASVSQAVLAAAVILVVLVSICTAQPPTADESIGKDRSFRLLAIKSGRNVATTPQRGFFGTIFHLIKDQINDTKSAYTQISDLVSNQFVDDNAITEKPVNGTAAESNKISRTELLRILDRNLKGLARLRSLEWREARKDTAANIRGYKEEIFNGKRAKNRR